MQRFMDFLAERAEINMAQRMMKGLSSEAQTAINAWEYSDWRDGTLQKSAGTKGPLFKEIYDAAEPLREAIRAKHGNTIKLYRGIDVSDLDHSKIKDRRIFSWSGRKGMANVFAGRATSSRGKVTNRFSTSFEHMVFGQFKSEKDFDGVQKKLDKDGLVLVKNIRVKRWKDDPKWSTVYYRDSGGKLKEYTYSEETDNIEAFLKRRFREDKEEQKKNQEKMKSESVVVEKQIPVDDILWVLNGGKSVEYIVIGHSGSDGKRI